MTYTHIKTAILPLYIKQTDPQANINEIERLVSLPVLKDTDVIVLPELFSTGFIAEPETILKYAEPTDGPTLNAIRRLSSQTGAAFAGSFICNAGNRFYNRAFFIEPDGKAAYYDKRHLFSVSPESRVLAPGRERSPIVRYKGWTFSMVICYDIRFPVWCRNVGQLYEPLYFLFPMTCFTSFMQALKFISTINKNTTVRIAKNTISLVTKRTVKPIIKMQMVFVTSFLSLKFIKTIFLVSTALITNTVTKLAQVAIAAP